MALARAPPRHPHIEQANHILRDVRLSERGVAFRSRAHSHREIHVAGLPPSAVVLQVVDGKKRAARTDDRGRLVVTFDRPGDSLVEVRTP